MQPQKDGRPVKPANEAEAVADQDRNSENARLRASAEEQGPSRRSFGEQQHDSLHDPYAEVAF